MRDPLLQALLSATEPSDAAPNCQLRFGTVTQVSPLLVKVGASTVGQPCRTLGSYAPVLNDYVAVLVQGADRIALGSAAVRNSFGFKVYRSTNEASLATGNARIVTFDTKIFDKGGFLPAGWTTGSSFTVPAGGAGVYAVQGAAYWVTNLASIFVAVRSNGVAIASSDAASADRHFVTGVSYLAVGDVIDLSVNNVSGSSITITTYPGDTNTTQLPMLSVWRMTS